MTNKAGSKLILPRVRAHKKVFRSKELLQPNLESAPEVLFRARMMYGLTIARQVGCYTPLGYDKVRVYKKKYKTTIVNRQLLIPNDEAFILLVKGKYLIKEFSVQDVVDWL